MSIDEGAPNADPGARRLKGAMLETSGLPVERMPGLATALDGFIAEAPKSLSPLVAHAPAAGVVDPPQPTTLFQAIGDCAGLTAAIYRSADLEARMLIALDDRIDDLVVASVFGESVAPAGDPESLDDEDAPHGRTPIETALIEEFARGLGRAVEAGFTPIAPLSLTFESLVTLTDAFALGRRDMPAAAARFSLPMSGGTCEGMVLLPQSLLLPYRKELERARAVETGKADRRWSHSIETGLKQTRLPVIAILEELPMRLGDIAALKVGAVLPLETHDFESVRLECAGKAMFLCKLGQGDGRYRLEVASSLAPPSEAQAP